jgi:hypothetical protein
VVAWPGGIHPSAVIGLPPRLFAPMTSIATSLLIVGRAPHERPFIGQVEGDDFDALERTGARAATGRRPSWVASSTATASAA